MRGLYYYYDAGFLLLPTLVLPSPKSKVVPIDVEIMNILNDAVSEAVRDAERRDGCEFVGEK